MAISDSFLDALVQRLDIVDVASGYVQLTRRGDGFWGLCPFHSEKTPSFHVSPSRQLYHCFGCGKGGGPIKFVCEMEHISFPDAVHKLADEVGLDVPEDGGDREYRERRKRILALNRDAARFYREMLKEPQGRAALEYIRSRRQISSRYSALFGLGAAPDDWNALIQAMTRRGYEERELLDAGLVAESKGRIYDKFRNRLMLPVISVRGEVIGFTSRILSEDKNAPKYMNTPETMVFHKRSVLYGMNYAKGTKRPNLILVEGNIDVITMHQAGFGNTIAPMGTALTEEHIKAISQYTRELVVCLDNDAAGEDATQRALALLRQSPLQVRVLRLPRRQTESGELMKQDPDDYIKNHGAGAFQNLLEGSSNSTEYRLAQVEGKYHLDQDDQRAAYLQEAAKIIAGLDSPVEREIYAGRCAGTARVAREAVLQEVEQLRRRKWKREQREEERRNLHPGQMMQPQARSLRFENTRSAQAELQLLQALLQDETGFAQIPDLTPEMFSSPVLGKAFSVLQRRWQGGQRVYPTALEAELSLEESDLVLGQVTGRPPMHNPGQVLQDCSAVIRDQHERAHTKLQNETDLLALAERLQKKGQLPAGTAGNAK